MPSYFTVLIPLMFVCFPSTISFFLGLMHKGIFFLNAEALETLDSTVLELKGVLTH